MLAFHRILLLSLTATSVFADWNKVLAKLKNPLDNPDLLNLKTTVNNYPSPSPNAAFLNVHNNLGKVLNDYNNVTVEINSSGAPTVQQLQSTYDYTCVQLLADLKAVLNAFTSKRDSFTTNGLKSAVKNDLSRLKVSIDTFFDAFINKFPTAALKSKGATCKANYDSACQSAINAFS